MGTLPDGRVSDRREGADPPWIAGFRGLVSGGGASGAALWALCPRLFSLSPLGWLEDTAAPPFGGCATINREMH
jgi:hypothetical protein